MDRWKILRSADWAIILTIIPAFNSTYTWYRARLPARSVRGALSLPTTRHVSKRRRFKCSKKDLAFHFSNLPLDFQIFPKKLLSRELETIRLDYKFSFSVLSGFIIIIITNSSLIEMIFQFCHSRPVISKEIPNLLFRVFRSRILLWDVNWKNLREESSQGNESKFFLPRLARCDKNGKRWTRRKGRLIYHDPAS